MMMMAMIEEDQVSSYTSLLWGSDKEQWRDVQSLSASTTDDDLFSFEVGKHSPNKMYLSLGDLSFQQSVVKELKDAFSVNWKDVHCFEAKGIDRIMNSVPDSMRSGGKLLDYLRHLSRSKQSASYLGYQRILSSMIDSVFSQKNLKLKSFLERQLQIATVTSTPQLIVVNHIDALNASTIRNLNFAFQLADIGAQERDLQNFVILFTGKNTISNVHSKENDQTVSWITQLGHQLNHPDAFFNGQAFLGRLSRVVRQGSVPFQSYNTDGGNLCSFLKDKKTAFLAEGSGPQVVSMDFSTFLSTVSIFIIFYHLWKKLTTNSSSKAKSMHIGVKEVQSIEVDSRINEDKEVHNSVVATQVEEIKAAVEAEEDEFEIHKIQSFTTIAGPRRNHPRSESFSSTTSTISTLSSASAVNNRKAHHKSKFTPYCPIGLEKTSYTHSHLVTPLKNKNRREVQFLCLQNSSCLCCVGKGDRTISKEEQPSSSAAILTRSASKRAAEQFSTPSRQPLDSESHIALHTRSKAKSTPLPVRDQL